MAMVNISHTIKKNRENIFIFVVMAVFSFFFLLKSPLHPWIGSDTGTDSSVFKTVALMMEKGYMPYKDSFDHKGPFLYILEWLGNRISGYRGIWVIEFVFMTITFFMIHKISRLKCQISSSVIVTLVSISLLFTYFEGGNLAEEYAMPMIAIAIYIFLDNFLNQKISKLRLMLCGVGLGATLLLRPNMISVWVIFCLLVVGTTVIQKRWKDLGYFTLWFVIGICIIVVPIIIWLGINNGLSACFETYIVFNLLYTSTEGGRALFTAKWNSYLTFFNTTVFIISFCTMAYLCKIKDRMLNIAYLIYMLVTLLFMCLSGMTFGHYGMVLVPMLAYPIALLFAEVEKIELPQVSQVLSIIISVFFLSTIIMPNWLSHIATIPTIYEGREETHNSELGTTISEIIDEHTSSDDAISVYGNWGFIYVISDRKHATRYSYQFPLDQVMPEIMEEYLKELHEEQPKLIVIQSGYFDDSIISFLTDNQYNMIWSENGESLDGALIFTK